MDLHTHIHAAREVSAAIERVFEGLAGAVSDDLHAAEQRVSEMLKAKSADLNRDAAERDKELVASVARKLQELRAEFIELVESIKEAHEARLVSVRSEILNEMRQGLANTRAALRDEIENANRSTHDLLLAEIRKRDEG